MSSPSLLLVVQSTIVSSLFVTLAQAQCRSADFPCRVDNCICIPLLKWQDGVEDCPDGSDEECLPWQYDCKFGSPRCVNLRNLNDGSIDCMSGFDEDCPAEYFVCSDKSDCISPDRYQDGRMDCKDGSDEPCKAAHFLCHDRSKCIHMSQFQDNLQDCPDRSDEMCTQFQFQCPCGSPRCIHYTDFNNGHSDCLDAVDENPGNLTVPSRCPDGKKPRSTTIVVPSPPPRPPMVLCNFSVLNHCKSELGEMCLIIAGAPRCMCKMGTIRPPGSKKCLPPPMVIEMEKCKTKNNYTTKPLDVRPKIPGAKIHQPVGPDAQNGVQSVCTVDGDNNCSAPNEQCVEISSKIYECRCIDGFERNRQQGLLCQKLIDECSDPSLNDCDLHAICMDNRHSYECFCQEGYIDISDVPRVKPGINCVPLINECEFPDKNDCDPNADCLDIPAGYTCRCNDGYQDFSSGGAGEPGRLCLKRENECTNGKNDCHPYSECLDHDQGYQCRCPVGFVDLSIDPVNEPGRQCAQLLNECTNKDGNDCDHYNGECVDTPEGFICRCRPGYIDQNPQTPGRNCSAGCE